MSRFTCKTGESLKEKFSGTSNCGSGDDWSRLYTGLAVRYTVRDFKEHLGRPDQLQRPGIEAGGGVRLISPSLLISLVVHMASNPNSVIILDTRSPKFSNRRQDVEIPDTVRPWRTGMPPRTLTEQQEMQTWMRSVSSLRTVILLGSSENPSSDPMVNATLDLLSASGTRPVEVLVLSSRIEALLQSPGWSPWLREEKMPQRKTSPSKKQRTEPEVQLAPFRSMRLVEIIPPSKSAGRMGVYVMPAFPSDPGRLQLAIERKSLASCIYFNVDSSKGVMSSMFSRFYTFDTFALQTGQSRTSNQTCSTGQFFGQVVDVISHELGRKRHLVIVGGEHLPAYSIAWFLTESCRNPPRAALAHVTRKLPGFSPLAIEVALLYRLCGEKPTSPADREEVVEMRKWLDARRLAAEIERKDTMEGLPEPELPSGMSPWEPLVTAMRENLSSEDFYEAARTVLTLADNIINDPSNRSKRRVRLGNQRIAQSLGRHKEALDVMKLAGWVEARDADETILVFPEHASLQGLRDVLLRLRDQLSIGSIAGV